MWNIHKYVLRENSYVYRSKIRCLVKIKGSLYFYQFFTFYNFFYVLFIRIFIFQVFRSLWEPWSRKVTWRPREGVRPGVTDPFSLWKDPIHQMMDSGAWPSVYPPNTDMSRQCQLYGLYPKHRQRGALLSTYVDRCHPLHVKYCRGQSPMKCDPLVWRVYR